MGAGVELLKERRKNFELTSKSRKALCFGDFRYEPDSGLLYRAGVEVPLAPRAQQVLHYLLEHAGRPVAKEELLDAIWKGAHVAETSLSEAIARAREALGDDAHDPSFIQTLHRRGYRFIAPVRSVPQEPADAWGRRPLVIGSVLLIGVLAGWGFSRLGGAGKLDRPVRFTVELNSGEEISLKGQPVLAMSRDGRKLIYTTRRDETTRLWLRELDRPDGTLLEGTEGAVAPFFSPDGERIGFFARGRLFTLALEEPAAVEIAAAPEPYGGTWLSGDRIAYSSGGRIHLVSSSGGRPEILAVWNRSGAHRWPEAFSEKSELLVTVWRGGPESAEIAVVDLESGLERPLGSGAYPKLVAPDRIVYARPGRILLRMLREQSSKTARTLLEGVRTDPFTGAAQFAVGGTSALAYLPGSASVVEPSRLRFADERGLLETLALDPAPIKNARLSPDGKAVALTLVEGGGTDVYVWTVAPRGLTRLTADGRSTGAVWSPDGTRLAFARSVEGRYGIYSAPVNGSGEPEPLVSGDFDAFPTSWSRDGTLLALDLHRPETGWDVFLLSLEGEPALRPVAESRFQERSPRLAPDGEWIAYQSDETGANEIYVRRLGAPEFRSRVSSGGGEWPLPGPVGDELYYHRGRMLMRARLEAESSQPEFLFDAAGGLVYDVASEGKFLVVVPAEESRPRSPHVILQWTALQTPD